MSHFRNKSDESKAPCVPVEKTQVFVESIPVESLPAMDKCWSYTTKHSLPQFPYSSRSSDMDGDQDEEDAMFCPTRRYKEFEDLPYHNDLELKGMRPRMSNANEYLYDNPLNVMKAETKKLRYVRSHSVVFVLFLYQGT